MHMAATVRMGGLVRTAMRALASAQLESATDVKTAKTRLDLKKIDGNIEIITIEKVIKEKLI